MALPYNNITEEYVKDATIIMAESILEYRNDPELTELFAKRIIRLNGGDANNGTKQGR